MSHIIITSPTFSAQYQSDNAQPMVSYRNVLTEKAVTNSLLPTVNPRANALTESTNDFWGPTGADTLRTITTGASLPVDVVFFDAHTLSGLTVDLQKWDGAAWVTVATVVPSDNRPFMIVIPTQSATGWGIQVSGACQIGVLWAGPREILEGGVTGGYEPVWASRVVKKLGGGSRKGHWLKQRIEAVTVQIQADLTPQKYSFITGALEPFVRHFENGLPFVWASAPSYFTTDVGYCWAEDEDHLEISILPGGDLCSLSMRMSVYAEP